MSASCSVHPEREAGATCSRCGTFACVTCLPAGATICSACIHRFDGEPLEKAIRWVSVRVSMLKIAVGLVSALVGVSVCVLFVMFIRSGIVGAAVGGCLAAMVIATGRGVSSRLVGLFAPRWISLAQVKFELHEEVLQELRAVLR